MVRKVLSGCNISLFGTNPSWDKEQHKKIPTWLAHLSGRLSSKFDSNTTHLIVSKKRWTEEPKPKVVQDALAALEQGRNLKVVTFSWLEDCLTSQSKKSESPYEWLKLDAQAAKLNAKSKKAAEREAKDAAKTAAKSVPGVLAEVFEESTEQFVDPREKEKLDRQLQFEREQKRAKENEEKEARMRRKKEQARLFANGSKKAQAILLTDLYHIYQDNTGFKYDVLLTKIDVRQNKNERWEILLKLFEHNEAPGSYAMAAQFNGTKRAPANNVVAALGSRWETAFHAFKTEFERLTGTEWDERISFHITRIRQSKLEQGVGTGSPAPASVRGAPVSETATKEVAFQDKKFEYHPPGYGPQGELTSEEIARLNVLGVKVINGSTERGPAARAPAVLPIDNAAAGDTRSAVEEWIRDADMSTVQGPPAGTDIDFDAMIEQEGIGYPFEKSAPQDASNDGVEKQPQMVEHETPLEQLNAGAVENNPAGDDDGMPALHTDHFDFDFDFNAPLPGSTMQLQNTESGQDDTQQTVLNTQYQDLRPDELSSLQPEVPSFATHPSNGTSLPHGTQEIGETQEAEKVRGEFLEVFEQQQQPTPPSSGKKRLGGNLNLGSSMLGKRKAQDDGEGGGKVAKMGGAVDGDA